MKSMFAATFVVALISVPLASTPSLAASPKDNIDSSTVQSNDTQPGTLPRYSGRSARRAMPGTNASGISGSDVAVPHICNNCDD